MVDNVMRIHTCGVSVSELRKKEISKVQDKGYIGGRYFGSHALKICITPNPYSTATQFRGVTTIDDAAGGRLRKLRPEEAWKTIEDFAQYEEEEWNKPESPDYIDATLEQELESIECRVESLMRSEVLLEYEVGFRRN
ncbi:hypothetical protein Tco_0540839 [Tanacetum coccineum]